MNKRKSKSKLVLVQTDHICPLCAASDVVTTWTRFAFQYGQGASAARLTVEVPARRCKSCDAEYLDEVGEQIKHDAICEHLGVLCPSQIAQLRKDYGMSRAKFSELTGIGMASLNRWENGHLMQSIANDRYLRILKYPEVMERLESLLKTHTPAREKNDNSRFSSIEISEKMLNEADHFRLHKAA